jgi:hypothetical protein
MDRLEVTADLMIQEIARIAFLDSGKPTQQSRGMTFHHPMIFFLKDWPKTSSIFCHCANDLYGPEG